MEIACPSCGKLSQATPCPRCGCELGVLFDLRRAADHALTQAAQFLRDGEIREAYEQAAHSWTLCHSAQAARVVFLASIALEDFSEAMKWRTRAQAAAIG